MDFRTIVQLPAPMTRLTPGSRVLLLGSCFAEHVGRRLQDALPDGQVAVNPFGVLYNPASVADALELLLDDAAPGDDRLFEGRDGLWHSRRHSGDFSAATASECRERIAGSLSAARRLLGQADLLCVTFGTARAYRHRASGWVVANCHKQPAAEFEEIDLGVVEMTERWQALLGRLHGWNERLHVVFTLSPYRYAKYGLHGSQLTKARLLLALDELCRRCGNATYFPAYEIVVDELRDYRFYERDMLHPSSQAIDYVWERFSEWAFTPDLCDFAREKAALVRDFAHRFLHPDSEAARLFVQKREERLRAFEEKWRVSSDMNNHRPGPAAAGRPSRKTE